MSEMDVRVQHLGECPPAPGAVSAPKFSDRYGFGCHLRYFTTETITRPSGHWEVSRGFSFPFTGAVMKHLPTGHVWVITDNEPEPWLGTMIHLGRWPD